MDEPRRDDALQKPLVHEGTAPDPVDSNEDGDEKATVVQPPGDPVEDAQQG